MKRIALIPAYMPDDKMIAIVRQLHDAIASEYLKRLRDMPKCFVMRKTVEKVKR